MGRSTPEGKQGRDQFLKNDSGSRWLRVVLRDDFKLGRGLRAKRLSTLAVVTVSLTIALFAPANVFTLVILARSALACTLGPLVIIHAIGNAPRRTKLS